jgi:protoheme IX farnesyltransferase
MTRDLFRKYYVLTKPGIIYGNVLTALAGFLLAAHWHIPVGLLLATLAGTSLVIASGCVFNNYLDRGIDNKMKRTQQRALVQGTVSGRSALIYATVLGILGFALILLFANVRVALVGLVGFIDYVVLYGYTKRQSVHGTIVGSISGAASVVAGYVAVTNRFDIGALLVFLLLVAWQMPHFYAIALYRSKDYGAAGIPVMPLKKGLAHTKTEIFVYIGLFVIVNILLTVYGYTGYVYLVVMTCISALWLAIGVRQPFSSSTAVVWGKQMFLYSLIVIVVLSFMLSVGGSLV